MDPHLRTFIAQWLRVAMVALLPVALTTFVSVPLNLGGEPGHPLAAREPGAHMT